MIQYLADKAPEIIVSFIGTLLALALAATLKRLKKRVYGGWTCELMVDGTVLDTDPLSPEDAEKMLEFKLPWWLVLVFGGTPTLKHEREVRQLLQSEVTPYGQVNGDVRDSTTVNGPRRVLQLTLTTGTNFAPRQAPKPPAPKPVATPTT
ncbi:MAG: hypothetical protein KBC95_00915 [Candidatus Peribacteraceae bacterium]|nr:hypothetical protein [Candidatus Peribacteraceae bacterium]